MTATDGRLTVRGRWFGVRGRRFLRPTLVVTSADGARHRGLADLDDKPWAAEDGELWQATFALHGSVEDAVRVELTVAPEITVILRGEGGAEPDGRAEAPAAAAPRAGDGTGTPGARAPAAPGPRPSRPLDPQRLTARLTAVQDAHDRERERRVETEAALDDVRGELHRTEAELARVRAELDLARSGARQARETSTELDAARRAIHLLQRRLDENQAALDRADDAYAALELDLEERNEALETTRAALDAQRDDHERARAELAEVRHGSASHREVVLGTGHHPAAHGTPRSERPMNPALRRTNWLLRLLALVVLAAFVVAVYLVLHGTVLHH